MPELGGGGGGWQPRHHISGHVLTAKASLRCHCGVLVTHMPEMPSRGAGVALLDGLGQVRAWNVIGLERKGIVGAAWVGLTL